MHRPTRPPFPTVPAAPIALPLAACAPPAASEDEQSSSSGGGDYRVGLITSLTGFAAATGTDMQRGWDLYWTQNGDQAGEYTVSTVVEDDASDPQSAVDKATRLVTDESVDVVVGPLLAGNALAVADYLTREGVANLSQTSADDISQRSSSPYVLRTGSAAGSQTTLAAGQWAVDEGLTRAATICPDYAFGWDTCGGFATSFLDGGGEIAAQLWYPQGTSDLSTYATQLGGLDVDVIFAGTTGGTDAIGFLRSVNDYGLADDAEIITGAATTTPNPLSQVGPSAVGLHSSTYYADGSESPEIEEFRTSYEEAYGAVPSVYAAGAYVTAELLAAALEESAGAKPVGADLVDLVKATAPEQEDLLWGDISFDDYNGIVTSIFITEVAAHDGGLWNTVDTQYDDVSQFWSFDPETWIENPAFSQTFTHQ